MTRKPKAKQDQELTPTSKSGVCDRCGHAGPFSLEIRNHSLIRICKCLDERNMDQGREGSEQ